MGAEALAALRSLESATQCNQDKSAGSSTSPCDREAGIGERNVFDSLSFTDRTDLLDLVAAVRGAEPLGTGALGPSPKSAFAPVRHQSIGGLSRASPTSSAASLGSLPALGRLSELAEEKLHEVYALQSRCDNALSGEERLETATLLA